MTDAQTEREDDMPISQAEIVALFGDAMPIEAAQLIQNANGTDITIAEMRSQLREIAAAEQAEPVDAVEPVQVPDAAGLVERLRRGVGADPDTYEIYEEAAAEIERLQKRCAMWENNFHRSQDNEDTALQKQDMAEAERDRLKTAHDHLKDENARLTLALGRAALERDNGD